MENTANIDAGLTANRARASKGISEAAIYAMVRAAMAFNRSESACLLDVGCGTGTLRKYVSDIVKCYAGADIILYDGYPRDCPFYTVNLDSQRLELSDASMDIVVSVETIEHIENPRALVRELARVAKPGGTVIITTPNNLSFLSKLTLVIKNEFNAFQEPCYPAHITALVERDVIRIMAEAGLKQPRVFYSDHGRIPGTPWHWPSCCFRGRTFSDNILVAAIKPQESE
jgi:2-polyprenyl-3-methyl-5-hydroxy-6-metoxy-1,4-benzoquinol methylase